MSKKLNESFLTDLARNTAAFLVGSAVAGRKPPKTNTELDDLYKDLDKTIDKFAAETRKEIEKMSPEKQKRLAKLAKSVPWK
jgi:hypothetical protein